ncbi:probable clathrin assembly protein At4g32285 [Vicia villosa]|uniref:probable clathrin assembly protein At4g32285 n=1 Tax=Vicia villosa TaxID=3911 RepID=UPI00273C7CC2|nr:probable clathrin assembly protein At4g32285 [Vicia villosa]
MPSSTSRTIRKAIGAMKDQTSISIAKVAGNIAPHIEVLVVKATSHDEIPADDKYVREIFNFTSYSKSYVNACLISITKRLSKTRDWIVAVKSLVLVHRFLTDRHPTFEDEIVRVHASREGMRIFNMSDFRDEAHSNSLDHASFVRVYALYLDEKVGFLAYKRGLRGGGVDESGDCEFGSVKRNGDTTVTPAERVLDRLKHLLRILNCVLDCKPSGAAKNNRLLSIALHHIVRDSFKVYVEIWDVLGVLMDRFMEMEYEQCVKAFEFYVRASKKMDELAGFYAWCKDLGIARSSEYPEVQRIPESLLGTLNGFLKEMGDRTKSPKVKVIGLVKEQELGFNELKALPASEIKNSTPQSQSPPLAPEIKNSTPQSQSPPLAPETKNSTPQSQSPPLALETKKSIPQSQSPPLAPEPKEAPRILQETGDLLNLRDDDNVLANEQGNKLEMALFSGASIVKTDGLWEEFSPSEVNTVWQKPGDEIGKADWELTLVETTSNLLKPKADLGGGFDSLLLNGMYDQGAVRQHVNSTDMSGGSYSSVALPGAGRNATPILALPAPDGTMQAVGTQDPFAASLSVPPPSYVQIAEMERKQHLLVQEQHLWQQYGRDGMQGQVGLTSVGGHAPGSQPMSYEMPSQDMMSYGMPQVGGIGQPGGYYNAPF